MGPWQVGAAKRRGLVVQLSCAASVDLGLFLGGFAECQGLPVAPLTLGGAGLFLFPRCALFP